MMLIPHLLKTWPCKYWIFLNCFLQGLGFPPTSLAHCQGPIYWLQEEPGKPEAAGPSPPRSQASAHRAPWHVCLIHLANQMFPPRTLKLEWEIQVGVECQ